MVDFIALVEKNEKFEQRKKRLQKEKTNFSSRKTKSENKAKILLGAYFYSDDKRLSSLMQEEDFIAYMNDKDFDFLRGMAYVAFPDKFDKPEEKENLLATDNPEENIQKNKKKKSKKTETQEMKNDTPAELNEVAESSTEAENENLQKIYLIETEKSDRDRIIADFDLVFEPGKRNIYWNFDTAKGKWFFLYDGKIDISPILEHWKVDREPIKNS